MENWETTKLTRLVEDTFFDIEGDRTGGYTVRVSIVGGPSFYIEPLLAETLEGGRIDRFRDIGTAAAAVEAYQADSTLRKIGHVRPEPVLVYSRAPLGLVEIFSDGSCTVIARTKTHEEAKAFAEAAMELLK